MMITEEMKKARRKAMALLVHMDRTEKGLSERLRQAGFSLEAVEDAVEYVRSYGYIDDERYAFHYISYRIHHKSRQKIMEELRQKGVERDVAASAWEKAAELEEPDEQAVLRRTIEKSVQEGARLDEKEMRRLYGRLARRGFKSADIAHVLEEMNIDCIF